MTTLARPIGGGFLVLLWLASAAEVAAAQVSADDAATQPAWVTFLIPLLGLIGALIAILPPLLNFLAGRKSVPRSESGLKVMISPAVEVKPMGEQEWKRQRRTMYWIAALQFVFGLGLFTFFLTSEGPLVMLLLAYFYLGLGGLLVYRANSLRPRGRAPWKAERELVVAGEFDEVIAECLQSIRAAGARVTGVDYQRRTVEGVRGKAPQQGERLIVRISSEQDGHVLTLVSESLSPSTSTRNEENIDRMIDRLIR